MKTETLENEGLETAFVNMRDQVEDFSPPMTIVQSDPFTGSYVTAQPCGKVRNEAVILAKMKAMAEAKGKDYYYSWEVKNKDGTVGIIEGGTIKLADDLSSAYMNCIVDVRSVDCGDHWMIYARFADLENGTAKVRPYRQRKTQNVGKGFKKSGDADRALDMMMQIGASKAARNVVMHSLRSMWDELVEVSKGAIVKRIANNPEGARKYIGDLLVKLKVEQRRAELLTGRKLETWTVPDMAKLWSILNSIKDGFINADDAFPSTETSDTPKEETKDELERLEKEAAKAKESKKAAKQKADAPKDEPKPEEKPVTTAHDPATGEVITDNNHVATGGGWTAEDDATIPRIDIKAYDVKTVAGVVKAGDDLIELLKGLPDIHRRLKCFEFSWGEQVVALLNEKGQGVKVNEIRSLTS